MADDTLQIKLMTIGDSGVGKSWILLRWSNENIKFNKNQSMPTIGIDFKMKSIEIDGKRIKLQIWDTAGQERFRTITTSYYRNSQGVILVYDVTNRASFESIRQWMAQIQIHADASINKILLGNKCDLIPQRAVSFDEGESLAKEFKIPFMETSALSNINIEESILRITKDVKTRLETVSTQPAAPGGKGAAPAAAAPAANKSSGTKSLSAADNNAPKKKSWC